MKQSSKHGLGPVKNNDVQVFGILIAALQSLPAVWCFAVCSALSPNYSGLLIRDAKLCGICLLWKWWAKQSFCLGFEALFSYSEGILCFRRNETGMLGVYRRFKLKGSFCNVQFSGLDSMLTGARIMTCYVFRICLSHHGHRSKLARKRQHDQSQIPVWCHLHNHCVCVCMLAFSPYFKSSFKNSLF